MPARTSASQAWGSTSFILAVYAEGRTMPNGRRRSRRSGGSSGRRAGLVPIPFGIGWGLQRVEEGEQMVVGTIADWLSALVWLQLRQGRFFQRDMGMEVSLRRFDRFM